MGKTRQVMADRADDPEALIAPGELLDMRFREDQPALSLRAAKLLHVLVAAAGAAACEAREHSIPLAEINSFHVSREELLTTARELMGVTVRLDGQTARGRRTTKMGVLVGYLELDEDVDGLLVFELSKILRTILKNSNHWGALRRQCVMAFKSRYALRLYEMIALRSRLVAKHSEDFTIDELRARLGVPAGKFGKWNDLNRFVIRTAIAEVNQLSGLQVTAQPVKRARAVVAVRLSWTPMSESERAAVARELAGHSLGRKARREGTVETIVQGPAPLRLGPGAPPPEFPPLGSLEGSGWDGLVLHLVPEDRRTIEALDDLADLFRMWARRAELPLTGSDIPGRWTAFVLSKFPPAEPGKAGRKP